MRIALTGATGFIGCRIAPLLVRDGHEVLAIVRPGSDRGLLRDVAGLSFVESELDAASLKPALRGRAPDLCIHLAWSGWFGPHARQDLNVPSLVASLGCLRAMGESGCHRFVATGSCVEYELDHELLNEATPLRPRNLYAATKAAFFLTAEQLCRGLGVSFAWTRLFHLYGPADEPTRLIPSILRSVVRGEHVPTTPGEQLRDYLYVDDVADAIWAVARSDHEGAVNVASGEPVSVRMVVEEIGRVSGRADLIDIGGIPYREGEPMRICADVALLRRATGWAPRYSLGEGLRRTFEWWRTNDMRSRALQ